MLNSKEISIDLTAQELLEPLALEEWTEIDDICDLDALELPGDVANLDQPHACISTTNDSVEIELTAQEIDALLAGMLSQS